MQGPLLCLQSYTLGQDIDSHTEQQLVTRDKGDQSAAALTSSIYVATFK